MTVSDRDAVGEVALDHVLPPPDWRWRRAAFLCRSGRRLTRNDDDRVQRALAYLRSVHNHADSSKRPIAEPELLEAVSLHRDADPSRRWEVEARIVARQTDTEIATRCSLTPAAVGWYHDLFLDVRGRLNAVGFVVASLIGLDTPAWQASPDQGQLMKFFGYRGGPELLDYYLTNYVRAAIPPEDVDPATLDDLELDRLRHWLACHAMVLTECDQDGPATSDKWLILYAATDWSEYLLPAVPWPAESLALPGIAPVSAREYVCTLETPPATQPRLARSA